MQITIATPYLPYPHVPHGGGRDLFHLIQALAQRHRIRVVSFTDAAQAVHAEALRPYLADLRLVWPAVTCRQQWHSAWKALRQGQWWYLGRRADRAARQAIAAWPADVLHCAWTEMGRYLAAARPGVVRVLDEVDVRFLVERAAGHNRWWVGRRRRQELAYCQDADLVLTRSAQDLAALRQALPGLRGLVLPPVAHVTDYASIRPEASVPGRVLFVGAMNRQRNQMAATWLVQAIWPAVRAACPRATLRIVGAEPPTHIRALAQKPGVSVPGWVADLRHEYAQARVVVAPMRSAAGALNKVLDGLAAGRPVVATAQANQGIAAPPKAIVVADEAAAFANVIVCLLQDDVLWRRVGTAGRRHVLAHFDWQTAVQQYEARLRQLVADRRRSDN